MTVVRKSVARGHHFLSQGYLKGFTPQGTQKSKLIILNLVEQTFFTTIPKNVGKERDFNTIDLEGFEPDYLESQLALFDDRADQAIRNIEKTGRFEGEDKIFVLNLIALFAIRNPQRREWWNSIIDHTSKIALSMAVSKVGRKSNGILITKDIKTFVDKGEFKIEAGRRDHIELELRVFEDVLHFLLQRKWSLVKASDDAEFVTCDRAVALIWNEPQNKIHSPGFGLKGTQVHFALSKKLALVGDFDGRNETVLTTKEQVALINANILLQAREWVYSSNKDFYFINPNGDTLFGLEKFWKEFNPKPSL